MRARPECSECTSLWENVDNISSCTIFYHVRSHSQVHNSVWAGEYVSREEMRASVWHSYCYNCSLMTRAAVYGVGLRRLVVVLRLLGRVRYAHG